MGKGIERAMITEVGIKGMISIEGVLVPHFILSESVKEVSRVHQDLRIRATSFHESRYTPKAYRDA